MTALLVGNGEDSQIRIQLSTKHQDIALPDHTGPILVSTNFRRYTLSTLVNNILETPKPVPFDFLINGQFLRTSLQEYLKTHGITAETTLSVEYVRALVPPTHAASFEHDAVVSAIDVLSDTSPAGSRAWSDDDSHAGLLGNERIAACDYGGNIRVWDTSSQVVASATASIFDRAPPLRCVKFLSTDRLVSGGMTGSIRVWKLDSKSENGSMSSSLTERLRLYGQGGTINGLAVQGPTSRILSASSDHSIALWSSSKTTGPAVNPDHIPQPRRSDTLITGTKKKRKLSTADTPPQRGPLALLKSHTHHVRSVIFKPDDPTVAYSASLDRSLTTWDLTTATPVDTRTTQQPLLSLAALPEANLLLTGNWATGTAPYIVGIDPRAGSASVAALTLHGHTNGVASLAAQPGNPWGCVSGSHDGTCRVWDVRSVKGGSREEGGRNGGSVYVIEREGWTRAERRKLVCGEGIQVFGVAWDKRVGIVSGGEDRRVQVDRETGGGGRDGGDTDIPDA